MSSSKTGALYDINGVIGATCTHGCAIPGSFCDMRGPENFVYYMVELMVIAMSCPDVQHVYIDFGCRVSVSWQRFMNALKTQRGLVSVPGENLCIMVNWLHAASHDFQCQLKNSGRYRTGAGWAVGEQAEQLWALTNAASGIIKYLTKPHRREFLEAVLEDINCMKQRALVLQLRTKWLSMCAKEKQLKQELVEIEIKARVAGVHNVEAAANAFYQRTLSPTESDNQDAVSANYVRLREMHEGKQALAQINRDWSLAVSQPRSVGELLLKGSNRREVNGLEQKLSSLEVRLGMTPTSTWQRSSQEYQTGLKILAEQEVL
eukprot:scaffold277290_cov22-Tisochrysis_lutea.AAC.1